MRQTIELIVAALAIGGTAGFSQAQHYVLEYEETFDTDPGWVTNSANIYWNSAADTLSGYQTNCDDSFAYAPHGSVDWNGGNLRLEWDYIVHACDWSAGLTFGIFDSILEYGKNSLVGDASIGDGGRLFALAAYGPCGGDANNGNRTNWQLGKWYSNTLTYDVATGLVRCEVRDRDSGTVVIAMEATLPCPLPNDADLVAVSRRHMHCYNGGGVSYEIDNIRFYEEATGPSLGVVATCPNGGPLQVTWAGATQNGKVDFYFARTLGTKLVPSGPCAGTQLDIGSASFQKAGSAWSDSQGGGSRNTRTGPGVCGGYLQMIDLTTCAASNTARIE